MVFVLNILLILFERQFLKCFNEIHRIVEFTCETFSKLENAIRQFSVQNGQTAEKKNSFLRCFEKWMRSKIFAWVLYKIGK